MRAEDIVHRVAVGCDPSTNIVEAPVVAQDRLQKVGIRARRDAVYGVIAAHDGRDLGIADTALEWRQVELAHVLGGHHRVERHAAVAFPIFQVVRREVLAVCDNLVVRLRVDPALQSLDEVEDILGDMEGILAGGFLSTAPARVLKWVNVWCEEVDACATGVVECARFSADDHGHFFDEIVVERCAH